MSSSLAPWYVRDLSGRSKHFHCLARRRPIEMVTSRRGQELIGVFEKKLFLSLPSGGLAPDRKVLAVLACYTPRTAVSAAKFLRK